MARCRYTCNNRTLQLPHIVVRGCTGRYVLLHYSRIWVTGDVLLARLRVQAFFWRVELSSERGQRVQSHEVNRDEFEYYIQWLIKQDRESEKPPSIQRPLNAYSRPGDARINHGKAKRRPDDATQGDKKSNHWSDQINLVVAFGPQSTVKFTFLPRK